MAERFSQQQIDVFKDCFNLYDNNHDGKVEKDELTKIMRALGHCVTHIEIHDILKECGSGTVTFPELLKILANHQSKNPEREVLDAFILSDKQKNGYVSRSELEHLLMKGGERLTREEVQKLLGQCGFDKMITQINYKDFAKKISEISPHPQ